MFMRSVALESMERDTAFIYHAIKVMEIWGKVNIQSSIVYVTKPWPKSTAIIFLVHSLQRCSKF